MSKLNIDIQSLVKLEFKLNQNVKGTYLRYVDDAFDGSSRERTDYSGVILQDFKDMSYEVLLPSGEKILVELYDEDEMEPNCNFK